MQITAVKIMNWGGGTLRLMVKLIIAVYASYVYVYISCMCLSGRLECNSLFVGVVGWGVRGSERKIWL